MPTLQPEPLAAGNLIFVGGVGGNPWVAEIQKHLAFEHVIGAREETRVFVNRSPRGGEPAILESNNNDKGPRYYTRVALLMNPIGSGRIASLVGISRMGTEAASQFAQSQDGLDKGQKLCGIPIDRLEGFEVILETKALAGTPVARTVVASRCKYSPSKYDARHHPHRPVQGRLSASARHRRGHLSELRRSYARYRCCELRVVGHVVDIPAQL